MKMEWTEDHDFRLAEEFLVSALPLQAQSCVGSITSRKNCEACENLAIRRSQVGSMERHFRATKRSTRFHRTRERISHLI